MPITLVEVQGLSNERKREISKYLNKRFSDSVTARSNQVDVKLKNWIDNYEAKPKVQVRTTPFYNASNFVPALIRMHSDILHARIYGFLYGTKPFWRPKVFSTKIKHEWYDALGEWMDFKSSGELRLPVVLDETLMQQIKTGVCTLKAPWVETSIYSMNQNSNAQEEVVKRKEGLCIEPIPFDDFYWYPITSKSLQQVICKFHKLRFAKEEVDFRKNTAIWDKAAAELLIKTGAGNRSEGASRDSAATFNGISITPDVSRPFCAIESWFNYELTPGKMFSLVATFNPFINSHDSILRLYYNYNQDPELDPFVDFRLIPRDNSYVGYCIPDILEQAQEEQAQIHNSRRDANTIANVPGWKKKRFADVANPSDEWFPGKVFEMDNMDDLQPLTFTTNYNSLIEEENALLGLAERYTGISAPMQGMGAGSMGKRGIYANSATLALLSEGNRRLDIYLKRLRYPFHKLGRIIYENYRQFRPTGEEYELAGDHGNLVQQVFSVKSPEGYRGSFFELGASDASTNKETDRTSYLLMANTMASYYKQVVEATQLVVQAPQGSPVQELLLQILDGARDLSNRILFAFDVPDRDRLLPDVRRVLGGKRVEEGPPALNEGRMLPPDEPVQVPAVQSLSERIGQVTSAIRSSNGSNGYQQ